MNLNLSLKNNVFQIEFELLLLFLHFVSLVLLFKASQPRRSFNVYVIENNNAWIRRV